jgi:predicted Zn-dependent protease
MRKSLLFLTGAIAALAPYSAPAQYQGEVLDQRYVARAQKQNPEVVREFGGAETGPRAAYVAAVGHRVGAFSGIADSGSALHFTLLNSAVDNAFSVPGGYVYLTRQLMALMDDESELAFTLGHEVGHVAARHAQQREAVENQLEWRIWPQILMGSIFGGVEAERAIGSLISAKLQTLSFSREQEYEADTLGLRYMIAAGYDPEGAPAILQAISRETALEARVQGRKNRKLPEWAMTHPLTENRIQRINADARASGRFGTGIRNRDQFLSELEGVYVDDDPAQGMIDGRTFTHPDLRIQFTVPVGYLMDNGTDAVSIDGSAGEAEFSGGAFRGSLDSFILAVLQQLSGGEQRLVVPQPRHTVINGIPAAYTSVRAQTDSGPVDVGVAAYQWGPGRVYYFATMTSAGTGFGPFASMVNSLRRLSPAEAAAIRPRVIHVYTVRPGDTVQSLAANMAYRDFKLDRFLSLNGLAANAQLRPGERVKLIVYGQRRA